MNPSWPLSAVVLCFCVQSGYAPDASVDAWTKPTSGYWEEPYWSLARLPAADEGLIDFTNAGWKALAIGQNTTANFSNSLVINDMIVEAPSNSFNQLLLNYAGTNVPLNVQWLTLGTNASLVSYYSALTAGSFYLDSSALFAESSRLNAGYVRLGASLTFSNSATSIGFLSMATNAVVNQSGGSGDISTVVLDASSVFSLDGGSLTLGGLFVEAYPDFPSGIILAGGTAAFVESSGEVAANLIALGTPGTEGEFLLEGGSLNPGQLRVWAGNFTQSGGTNTVATLDLPFGPYGYATYSLSGGTLVSSNITLGFFENPNSWFGYFVQSGGFHTNESISLPGYLVEAYPGGYQYGWWAGSYSLSGGVLMSGQIDLSGPFTQTGGTNQTQYLSIHDGGYYSLTTGALVTTDTSIEGFQRDFYGPYACSPTTVFYQQSGSQTVADSLTLANFANYDFEAGKLAVQDLTVGATAELDCRSGIVSNWGTFTLQGGVFIPGNQSHYLGQLQLLAVTNWPWLCSNTGPFSLDLSGPSGTVLRFRDSRDAVWSAPGLRLLGWQPWGGGGSSHHVFFGTNSQGLTQAQLSKLTFVNPSGWPPGSYPAQILATGEVVPAVPPPLIIAGSSNALVLSWAGDYELLSATNVSGPYSPMAGAFSPMTNLFTAPQKYFRLGLPGP